MRLLISALLLMSAPIMAAAQPAPPAPTAGLSEKMAPFAWLIGEWRGSGWTILPDGRRETFDSHEVVTPRIGGNALLVEGRHTASGHPDVVVHDALAMMTWDRAANAYRFRSALANGLGGDSPVEVRANGFTWSIDTPGGRIDYVVAHENGTWTERGRLTRAGGQTSDFFEMSLRKH
jgi:hypothetical protein